MKKLIPVGISARHIHLSQDHLEFLFGEDYELTPLKELSQPNTFACEETVTIKSETGKEIKDVRIILPVEDRTVVVISRSDSIKYDFVAPIREVNDLADSGQALIIGPKGEIKISEGVICEKRHIHFSPQEAKEFNVSNKEIVSVKIEGEKGGIMDNVICHVSNNYKLDFHIDVDDADAFGLNQGDLVELLK